MKKKNVCSIKLITASNKTEAGMIQGLLENNSIQSMVISPHAGSRMNIKAGASFFGEEIYVDEEDIEAANSSISSLS